MNDIEIATTEQLIEELFSRPTFVGVLIHSTEQHRADGQKHADWVVRSTCDLPGTAAVIAKAAESVL